MMRILFHRTIPSLWCIMQSTKHVPAILVQGFISILYIESSTLVRTSVGEDAEVEGLQSLQPRVINEECSVG